MMLRRCALVALAGLVAGCYVYVPVERAEVRPGEQIRARLSLEGARRIESLIGTGDERLEGELLETNGEGMLLYMPAAERRVGFHTETLSQRIRIQEGEVLALERKILDRGRTALAAGITGAVIAAIAVDALSGKSGGPTQPSGPPGPSASFRLRVGLRGR